MSNERSGSVIRCHEPALPSVWFLGAWRPSPRCGWVGDSGDAVVWPSGEERCPKCVGTTTSPLKFTKETPCPP